jgi:hypothetical protein
VTDFGLSVRDFGGAVRDGADRAVTNPTWLAPEVLLSNSFTTASDVYAFGLVLWELQTRAHPWEAEAFQFMYQLEDAITKGRRPLLPLDAEPKLAELTARAWAANPLERPTFEELCGAIARVAAQRAPHIHASRVSASGEAIDAARTTTVPTVAAPPPTVPPTMTSCCQSACSFSIAAQCRRLARVMSLAVVREAGHVWCGAATASSRCTRLWRPAARSSRGARTTAPWCRCSVCVWLDVERVAGRFGARVAVLGRRRASASSTSRRRALLRRCRAASMNK